MEIKKILLPIDFSPCSDAATDYVLSIASKFNSKVVLMCVIDETVTGHGWYVPHISLDELFKDMELEAAKRADRCMYDRFRDFEHVEKVVVRGIPDEEISRYANENGVDLVVMGAFSRSGTLDFVFGSTAEKVIRKTTCPVLCVKVQPE